MLKASVANGLGDAAGGLQVISVSNDRTEADFDEYCGAMPWASIPYARAQEVKANLRDRFAVKTIPTLVVLDAATGEVITKAGRDRVETDPTGEYFPWATGSGADKAIAISIQGAVGGGGGSSTPTPFKAFGVASRGDGGNGGMSWRHLTYRERVFTKPLLAMGHRGINPNRPDDLYMDENAVRVRAGIFNIVTVLVLMNLTFTKWWGSAALSQRSVTLHPPRRNSS